MTANEIATILSAKSAGTFYTLVTRRPAKVRKGVADDIVKVSTLQGMLTDYARRKAVREAVASGERDAPELPKHIAESFELNGVRFWRGHNGREYLPVPLTGNAARSRWERNGAEVTLDEIRDLLLASETAARPDKDELADKGQVPFIAIGVENVEAVH